MLITNLVNNALKFSAGEVEIKLEVDPGTTELLIQVIDQGIGISQRIKLKYLSGVKEVKM